MLNAGKEFPSSVQVQGLITMEDVIEALIDEPILDEFDTPQQPGMCWNATFVQRLLQPPTKIDQSAPKPRLAVVNPRLHAQTLLVDVIFLVLLV